MKAPKSQGIYVFADGYNMWVFSLTAAQKQVYIKEHGPIVKFTHTA